MSSRPGKVTSGAYDYSMYQPDDLDTSVVPCLPDPVAQVRNMFESQHRLHGFIGLTQTLVALFLLHRITHAREPTYNSGTDASARVFVIRGFAVVVAGACSILGLSLALVHLCWPDLDHAKSNFRTWKFVSTGVAAALCMLVGVYLGTQCLSEDGGFDECDDHGEARAPTVLSIVLCSLYFLSMCLGMVECLAASAEPTHRSLPPLKNFDLFSTREERQLRVM